MKASKYNFVFENKDEEYKDVVLYNSRTGALAVLQPNNYKQYTNLINNKGTIDEVFKKQLFDCGFIVDDLFDEIECIRTNIYRSRFDSNRLALTIAPTMACNFRCVYCYEKGQYKSSKMSIETADNIIEYIREQAERLEVLNVAWYGGEPLLAMDIISYMSKNILDICKKYNIKYECTAVTNGYFLTPEIAKQMKEYGVEKIQVTLDGPQEIHDKRRPLANGKGTFDVILENVKQAKKIIPICIRINTDFQNWKNLDEVVGQIKEDNELNDDITIYLGLVTPTNDKYDNEKCMSDEIYSNFNLQFMVHHNIPITYIYPTPKGNYCTADRNNSWVIDVDGYLYKCWSDIGIKERCVGCINNEIAITPNCKLLNDYMLYDPTNDKKCEDCLYLPICLGGCPQNRISLFNICEQYKYNLEEYIKECTKIMLKSQKEGKK